MKNVFFAILFLFFIPHSFASADIVFENWLQNDTAQQCTTTPSGVADCNHLGFQFTLTEETEITSLKLNLSTSATLASTSISTGIDGTGDILAVSNDILVNNTNLATTLITSEDDTDWDIFTFTPTTIPAGTYYINIRKNTANNSVLQVKLYCGFTIPCSPNPYPLTRLANIISRSPQFILYGNGIVVASSNSTWRSENGFWGSTTATDITGTMVASVQQTGGNMWPLFKILGIPVLFLIATWLVYLINGVLTPKEETIEGKPKRKRGRPRKNLEIINPEGEDIIYHSASDLEFKRNYGQEKQE